MPSSVLPRATLALAWALPSLAVMPAATAQGDLLCSVSTTDVRVIDPLTGLTLSATPIVVPSFGNGVDRCSALAAHPGSGVLYFIVEEVEVGSTTPRWLGTLDPLTGVASLIATLPDVFSGLAFRSDGTLFAVTGAGAATPQSLYTIDIATGTPTFRTAVPAGNNVYWDVGCITFAPDGFLYRMSGNGIDNVDEVMQRIDTQNGDAITQVLFTGDSPDEMQSMTPYTGGNILAADGDNDWYVITTAGRASRLGNHGAPDIRGLAYFRSPNSQPFLRPYGDGCLHVTDRIPMLVGSGTPALASTVRFDIVFAPKIAFGAFVFGFGNNAQPIPSPRCQVQVMPLLQGAAPFFTNDQGKTHTNIPIPFNILPCDLYLQAGVLGFGEFLVTNPVRLHIL
jgi:hypothetical protein